MGVDAFARAAARGAGVAGVVLPDVSFEESPRFARRCVAAGLAYVDLVAPTSDDGARREIARASDGFVYLVSITGVTGSRGARAADVGKASSRACAPRPIRRSTSASASRARRRRRRSQPVADGVIIGSRLVQLAGDGRARKRRLARVGDFVASVRGALDRWRRDARRGS